MILNKKYTYSEFLFTPSLHLHSVTHTPGIIHIVFRNAATKCYSGTYDMSPPLVYIHA